MTEFRPSPDELRLLRRLCRPRAGRRGARRAATRRVVWSHLTEPGDAVGGAAHRRPRSARGAHRSRGQATERPSRRLEPSSCRTPASAGCRGSPETPCADSLELAARTGSASARAGRRRVAREARRPRPRTRRSSCGCGATYRRRPPRSTPSRSSARAPPPRTASTSPSTSPPSSAHRGSSSSRARRTASTARPTARRSRRAARRSRCSRAAWTVRTRPGTAT